LWGSVSAYFSYRMVRCWSKKPPLRTALIALEHEVEELGFQLRDFQLQKLNIVIELNIVLVMLLVHSYSSFVTFFELLEVYLLFADDSYGRRALLRGA